MMDLGKLYSDFIRIDLDARGGYARVADTVAHLEDGTTVRRAFKLMRHELEKKFLGVQRFENELKMLIEITRDKNAPSALTRIYDSGFAPVDLSKTLHNLHEGEKLNPSLEIIPTGTDIKKFLELKSVLMEKEPDSWVPYLTVDLAPYSDSLLRQIKPQSASDLLNLYRLPVKTIVEMALQLSDVMDYLHKKFGYAYIDWKPEHIYWNEPLKQLKLIDWNVTRQLKDTPGENKNIREDLRMFCGAALYCGLALTDPEDPSTPIGPDPKIPKELESLIRPRYWTDRPDFYQRDNILDEDIKLLVQKGLDPNQGFNSPQELKRALSHYAEQSDKRSNERSDEQSNKDLIAKLPIDSVHHYKRARSYIAAKDYLYAKLALEVAVETAKSAGMVYPDAEKLLISVQSILDADELKQKIKLALELGQWKTAINLYNKAIALEPANTTIKKELDDLQALLYAETELRHKGVFRIFTNLYRLHIVLRSAKNIINPNNSLYKFVKQQYNQIRLAQLGGMFLLLSLILFGSVSTGKLSFPELFPTPVVTSSTNNLTLIPSVTFTQEISTPVSTSTPAITPTVTITNTLQPPTPTATIVQNYGVLGVSFFYPVDAPNGKRVGPVLAINQFLTIVDSKVDREAIWYKCVWEANGISSEGWILGEKIKFVAPPTPTP